MSNDSIFEREIKITTFNYYYNINQFKIDNPKLIEWKRYGSNPELEVIVYYEEIFDTENKPLHTISYEGPFNPDGTRCIYSRTCTNFITDYEKFDSLFHKYWDNIEPIEEWEKKYKIILPLRKIYLIEPIEFRLNHPNLEITYDFQKINEKVDPLYFDPVEKKYYWYYRDLKHNSSCFVEYQELKNEKQFKRILPYLIMLCGGNNTEKYLKEL